MCGAGMLATRPARAQAIPTTTPSASAATAQNRSSGEGLAAERQRLRADLARVQGEIDLLKRGDRGLRADYQLRARLADAEAIARRLTEIDDRLRVLSPGTAVARPVAPIGDEPVASPADGPQELDAKADILADQAHRVQAQAAALKTRIDQVRARRELRRRAHQLESDPFAPLEGSKRRLLTNGPTVPRETPGNAAATKVSDSAPPPGGPASPAAGGTTTGTGFTGSSTQTPSTSQPVPPTDSRATSTAASPVQVHDQLDQGALSVARKPGAGVTATNDVDAMERELAALNARAQHLETQARALRSRAHAH